MSELHLQGNCCNCCLNILTAHDDKADVLKIV